LRGNTKEVFFKLWNGHENIDRLAINHQDELFRVLALELFKYKLAFFLRFHVSHKE
jgi:hypothetical protein